jgi:hypothetical protein
MSQASYQTALPRGRKHTMMKFLWLQFPKDKDRSAELFPGLPPLPPVVKSGEVKVTIHAVLHFNPMEGFIASQAGCLMDVIAAMAKDAGCKQGRLDAMWDEE